MALIMVVSQGLRYILDENVQYAENILGAQASNAMIALLYEKNLRVYPAHEFSTGEVVNFVQTDCSKMYLFVQCLPWIVCLPFELAACLVILFMYLGVSFLSGIAIFVVSILFNIVLAGATAKVQRAYMKKQD